MNDTAPLLCTAFAGPRQIASGTLEQVALKAKALLDADPQVSLLIFNDTTSELVEVDFRGTSDEVLRRLPQATGDSTPPSAAARGPGRPRLGVVAREVTLLPRHWEWLNKQPGGASVVLRKLVDEAKRASGATDRKRQSQEASLRFMSAIAGDYPGYEEAARALFAGQGQRFREVTASFPADIGAHLGKLAEAAFQTATGPSTEAP